MLKQLEDAGFDIRSCVNGALVVFSNLTGDEQKEAITKANGSGLEPLRGPEQEFRQRVIEILQEAQTVGGRKKLGQKAVFLYIEARNEASLLLSTKNPIFSQATLRLSFVKGFITANDVTQKITDGKIVNKTPEEIEAEKKS